MKNNVKISDFFLGVLSDMCYTRPMNKVITAEEALTWYANEHPEEFRSKDDFFAFAQHGDYRVLDTYMENLGYTLRNGDYVKEVH